MLNTGLQFSNHHAKLNPNRQGKVGMAETGATAASIHGDKLYQERARRAFPILVRQAEARKTIYYSDLAEELGMPNPRNLNYVLGSIGQTLQELSDELNNEIPPIQCIVINKSDGMPGEGIGWFLNKESYSGVVPEDFKKLPKLRQKEIVQAELQKVYLYDKWREVLEYLSLEPVSDDFSRVLAETRAFGGGESDAHKLLKEYVAQNPTLIGLPASSPKGQTEQRLLSGDALDVSFSLPERWIAAEVKSHISGEPDIVRGLFQCVKYKAVMAATQLVEKDQASVESVLVLEGELPKHLVPLRNMLGVTVFQNVRPAT
ncbi:hypothetical protein [Nioella aestuarii]|uniref:hypothetical protein n=1 Tax=Nioella aestuarii TaxID=1662864 RepID=UPI003D7F2A99